MNIGVHVSFRIRVFVFSRDMPRSGIAGWVEYLNRNTNIGKNGEEGNSQSLGILFGGHILPVLFHFVKSCRLVCRINCLRVAWDICKANSLLHFQLSTEWQRL